MALVSWIRDIGLDADRDKQAFHKLKEVWVIITARLAQDSLPISLERFESFELFSQNARHLEMSQGLLSPRRVTDIRRMRKNNGSGVFKF